MTPIALDSNVLIYVARVARAEADARKIADVEGLLVRLGGKARFVAPAQALGETYVVMQRAGYTRDEARDKLFGLMERFDVAIAAEATFTTALDLATDHKLQFWDSLILATAADAGCGLLLSEDMQDGFEWRGVTVADPFAAKLHKRLARVLG